MLFKRQTVCIWLTLFTVPALLSERSESHGYSFREAPPINGICEQEPSNLRLLVIGDSMFDNGNNARLTGCFVSRTALPEELSSLYPWQLNYFPSLFYGFLSKSPIPSKPYIGGGFSNGLVTSSWLSEFLNLGSQSSSQYQNLAHGSATVLEHYSHSPLSLLRWLFNVPVTRQWSFLAGREKSFRKTDILLIDGGYNDYRRGYRSPEKISEIVAAVDGIVRDFLQLGGGIVIMGTLGDLTKTPCHENSPDKADLKRALDEHNKQTRSRYQQLQKQGKNVLLIDYEKLFNVIRDEFERSALEVNKPCFKITFRPCSAIPSGYVDLLESEKAENACPDPNEHLFIDTLHFSERAHFLIAAVIRKQLESSGFINQAPSYDEKRDDAWVNRVYRRYTNSAF